MIIAIDGPGASGKSTVARGVARALGFLYVDTGAMYRTLAWHCLQTGIDLGNPKAVASACRRWKTRLHRVEGDPAEVVLLVEGFHPAEALRTTAVAKAASDVAVVAPVRIWMKRRQRECAEFGDLVMEGRDIGTNVFPETDWKFWLDADATERTRRRAAQGVEENLAYRDRQDSQRRATPLMAGLGAVRIDTTPLSAAEVIARIVGSIRTTARSESAALPFRSPS